MHTRVVDLGGERNLVVHLFTFKACLVANTRTVGGLKGYSSGNSTLYLNVPFLYGLSSCVASSKQRPRSSDQSSHQRLDCAVPNQQIILSRLNLKSLKSHALALKTMAHGCHLR